MKSTMREIQSDELKKIEMEMLREIDTICREANIVYYAIGGTLLGAVRHEGFIPWDDDIDIAMFEPDYNKFRTVINSRKSNLRFDCIEDSKDYPYAYGKLCRTDTIIKEKSLKGYNNAGVFIDVFRIDGRGKEKQALALYSKLNRIQTCWVSSFSLQCESNQNIIKSVYWRIRYLWRNRKNARQWAEFMDLVSKKEAVTWNDNEFCSWIHEKPFPYEIFKEVIYMKFEDIFLPCPVGYKEFLKIKYGNYMELPPVSEQVSNHSFIAYFRGGGQNK
ncbi:LicD family protein [Agathobacter sp.]